MSPLISHVLSGRGGHVEQNVKLFCYSFMQLRHSRQEQNRKIAVVSSAPMHQKKEVQYTYEHLYYMRRAIALAVKGRSTKGGAPFGAVIIRDDEIISEAFNTVALEKDCTCHAEIMAIRRACQKLSTKDLSDCELYTSCEPCLMCLGSCFWADLKGIYFGASAQDAKAHGYHYSAMHYQSDPELRYREFRMKQILREEAIKVWIPG